MDCRIKSGNDKKTNGFGTAMDARFKLVLGPAYGRTREPEHDGGVDGGWLCQRLRGGGMKGVKGTLLFSPLRSRFRSSMDPRGKPEGDV